MGGDDDQFRQAQREVLNRAASEPEPDAEAARRNAEERVRSSSGPAPDMVRNNQWANEYDRKVQAKQAVIHAANQEKTGDTPRRAEEPAKPPEQEKVEARRGLGDGDAALRKSESATPSRRDAADGPEKEKSDASAYRRVEREGADREQGDKAQSTINQYRRDFGDRGRER